MNKDEQAIRDLVERWWSAARSNDVDAALDLIADDVVFMVSGAEPFSKEDFETQARRMKDVRMDGRTEVLEMEVLGDRAWMRVHITVDMTMPDGIRQHREGYGLQILRKGPHGNWAMLRDANMLPLMPMPGMEQNGTRAFEEPLVAKTGVAGFHPTTEEGDGRPLARMELDPDAPGRVNTGTGDQPGNTGGDRFATPPQATEHQ